MRCNQSSRGGLWGSSQCCSWGLWSTVGPAGLCATQGCPAWSLGAGTKISSVGLLLERLRSLPSVPFVGPTGCFYCEGRDLCIGACSRKESAVFSWLEACPQVNLLLFWSSAFSSFCVEEEGLSYDSSMNLFRAVQITADKSMSTVTSTAICPFICLAIDL